MTPGRGEHWPLLIIGLGLALSPWLTGFAGEPAAWVAWILGLVLVVIGRTHTRTVAQLVVAELVAAQMTVTGRTPPPRQRRQTYWPPCKDKERYDHRIKEVW